MMEELRRKCGTGEMNVGRAADIPGRGGLSLSLTLEKDLKLEFLFSELNNDNENQS